MQTADYHLQAAAIRFCPTLPSPQSPPTTHHSPPTTPTTPPTTQIGLLFVVLGGASSLANDGLLPQSTLAPLTAQTILYKSLLSRWILRVPISRMHGFALITMSVGMVIATLGANLDDGVYSLQVSRRLTPGPLQKERKRRKQTKLLLDPTEIFTFHSWSR